MKWEIRNFLSMSKVSQAWEELSGEYKKPKSKGATKKSKALLNSILNMKMEVEKENGTEHNNTIHEHEQKRKAETGTHGAQKQKRRRHRRN